jgi:hypothetical protein
MNSVGQIWHLARLTLGEHLVFGKIGLPLGETIGNGGIGIIPKFINDNSMLVIIPPISIARFCLAVTVFG